MPQFWRITNNMQTGTAELHIDGDIVDDGDAWFYQLLGITSASPNELRDAIRAAHGKHLDVWINSYGGSVFAAAGIYNALKEHGNVRVIVDGIAASAASVIAMAGDRVEMTPVGMMMIHDPMTSVEDGNAQDMRRAADMLDKVKETIVSAYMQKTGRDRDEIWQLMTAETYMPSADAVKLGFADAVHYPPEGVKTTNRLYSGSKARASSDSMRTALASIVARMDKPDGTPTAAVPGEPDAEPTPEPDAAPTPTDSAAELQLARARLALKARTMQY